MMNEEAKIYILINTYTDKIIFVAFILWQRIAHFGVGKLEFWGKKEKKIFSTKKVKSKKFEYGFLFADSHVCRSD